MRRVILESPYAGNVIRNTRYARDAMRDSLKRGEAPIASHLLYTQPGILRDDEPGEREKGITAGLSWGAAAEATVVYTDFGISPGMTRGIEDAWRAERPVEYRRLFKDAVKFYAPPSVKKCGNCLRWKRESFEGPYRPEMKNPGVCALDGMRTDYDDSCGFHEVGHCPLPACFYSE
jgi:hypothetical protein